MRNSSQLNRLKKSDLKKMQRTLKEKVQKQVQGLIQLIDLPDFDISQFFQTLMKSQKYQEVLQKIPRQKQIDFFTRNFKTFLQTQEQLLKLKLPELQEIPKAKQFYFQQPEKEKKQQNTDQSSVNEIVDSFSTAALQKNTKEIVRVYQIIKEMKKHEKYEEYFNKYEINKLLRQSFDTFIEDCEQSQILIEVGESKQALKKFLKHKTTQFLGYTQTQINIDSSSYNIKKIVIRLLQVIENTIKEVKHEYSDSIIEPIEVDVLLPKWLSSISKEFYQIIEPIIFQKEELSDILTTFQVLLENCRSIESKGICLTRQFKIMISHDLPLHMNKVVQVVVEAFEDILKEDNTLYEFKYFEGMVSFAEEIDNLVRIQKDYSKKCCSQKGILLINAFVIILEPMCDQKWSFMHQNILQSLLNKVSNTILISNWIYWDYYHLFQFFERLQNGKIKHKRLFESEVPPYLKQKIHNVKDLSIECWEIFQNKLTTQFWIEVLSKIPELLWEIGPTIHSKQRSSSLKPTVFSIDLFFKIEEFLKNIQFRLQRTQYEFLVLKYYQYILYVIEYIIYWNYHDHGSKDKVFFLYTISQRIYKKAKVFAIDELQIIKEHKKIVLVSHFTKYGLQHFALDLYFLTEAIKMITEKSKLNCEQMVLKIAKIQAKQHKTDAVNLQKNKYTEGLNKFLKVLKDQPQKIRAYLGSIRSQKKK